eukprot:snap_masked-scaffold_1-processed-gene-13.1-mRNA-1 protein AED:1.00 eAED:1.00 QI:0/0/0/0/1/1/2/0/170
MVESQKNGARSSIFRRKLSSVLNSPQGSEIKDRKWRISDRYLGGQLRKGKTAGVEKSVGNVQRPVELPLLRQVPLPPRIEGADLPTKFKNLDDVSKLDALEEEFVEVKEKVVPRNEFEENFLQIDAAAQKRDYLSIFVLLMSTVIAVFMELFQEAYDVIRRVSNIYFFKT